MFIKQGIYEFEFYSNIISEIRYCLRIHSCFPTVFSEFDRNFYKCGNTLRIIMEHLKTLEHKKQTNLRELDSRK